MLAAPRSPLCTPASCAASLRARYSPPKLTCCRRSALPGSTLPVLQPPPHLCGKVAVLHPRLTRRLPTPRAPDAHLIRAHMHHSSRRDAHEQAAQVGKAHKSAAKRGDSRGEGHRLIKCAKATARTFAPHLLSDHPRCVDCSRISLESNDAMAGSDISHPSTKLQDAGARVH